MSHICIGLKPKMRRVLHLLHVPFMTYDKGTFFAWSKLVRPLRTGSGHCLRADILHFAYLEEYEFYVVLDNDNY